MLCKSIASDAAAGSLLPIWEFDQALFCTATGQSPPRSSGQSPPLVGKRRRWGVAPGPSERQLGAFCEPSTRICTEGNSIPILLRQSKVPDEDSLRQPVRSIKTTKPDEVQGLAKELSNISTVVDMDDAASVTTSSSVGKVQGADRAVKELTYDIDELASLQSQMSASDRVKAWNTKRNHLEALSRAAPAKDFQNLADVSHHSCVGSPEDWQMDWQTGKLARQ